MGTYTNLGDFQCPTRLCIHTLTSTRIHTHYATAGCPPKCCTTARRGSICPQSCFAPFTTGKLVICRVLGSLWCAFYRAHSKKLLCRMPFIAHIVKKKHTTNTYFVVCSFLAQDEIMGSVRRVLFRVCKKSVEHCMLVVCIFSTHDKVTAKS
jgi:hypothetical protein